MNNEKRLVDAEAAKWLRERAEAHVNGPDAFAIGISAGITLALEKLGLEEAKS